MEKILGLDLGTSSVGWAIAEYNGTEYKLLNKGVSIFQEGVARDKGNEKPAVQDRTDARASRRHYFRRRLHKIQLLQVLIREGFCPPLTSEQLDLWRKKKIYPLTEDFIQWQRTDDNKDKNPYHDRFIALTETLDLNKQYDRYLLGRALYHLCQRRGFLSNRKNLDSGEDGKVKTGIHKLTEEMSEAGCKYLGEYFYRIYRQQNIDGGTDVEKIRSRYTARKEHYETEFYAICERQHLSDSLQKELYRAIFYQRPLKSQKGLVGKCTLEKGKSRCPLSHPRFEEFRMHSFINNIRIQTPQDSDPRQLTSNEVKVIAPLFFRKSKPHFEFKEIAKKIAGDGRYLCKGDKDCGKPYRFNFAEEMTVSGCPVIAALQSVFGENWLSEICSVYKLAERKSEEQILNDVWHALFSFDDEDKLEVWAKDKLQLPEEDAKKFSKIILPQGYASLSLNAINKILPYLRQGYRYDEAVFLANLKAVLPPDLYNDEGERKATEYDIRSIIDDFQRNPLNKKTTKEYCVVDYLRNRNIGEARLERLYHPSKIETYPHAMPNKYGVLQLGSPRTSSVRNPMAMRALFRLRILINELLRTGEIDKDTKINIEFARGLNDANKRKAIEQYQREREKDHQRFRKEIKEHFQKEMGREIEPTEEDVLKYRLWEEQKHICLYTGDTIGIADFIGDDPKYDIEHTVPKERGGDDSQMNKTLCLNKFNRSIKKAKLPSELSNHDEVLSRIESCNWKKRIEELHKQIEIQKQKSRSATTKEGKDSAICRRHELQMQLRYWQGKYERFTITEVPSGFSNRQGVDIGIIGKYARLYLQTVFDKIYTVKGETTAAFRKMWGLQEEYTKKERTNHIHHCIDAITIACIGRKEYDLWAQYAVDEERYARGEAGKPCFVKPWKSFTEDVKAVSEEVLIAHYTPDNMPKQSKKKVRVRGKIKRDKANAPIFAQGDTARGVLHQQTFYGAIIRNEEVKYVVRKSLDQLKSEDLSKIVDDVVRERVQEAVKKYGFKDAMDSTKHTIWMNEEKGVAIRKVRIYATLTQPIILKKQRDLSAKEYKQNYYVANDGNYCMAIYEGTDKKGKTKRTFKIVSNIEAAQYFKKSTDKTEHPGLVPASDENDYPLKCILKTGTMVLFYEKSPSEFDHCTQEDLVKRLYKVTGMSQMRLRRPSGKIDEYGTLQIKHHQEARPAGELKSKNGAWHNGEVYRPIIAMCHTQLNAYIEGVDFELSVTGEIIFKHEHKC